MSVLCHPLSASGDDWFLAAENILSASFCTGRTLSWRNGRTALEMPGVLLQGQLGEACTSKDVLPCCVTCAHIISVLQGSGSRLSDREYLALPVATICAGHTRRRRK